MSAPSTARKHRGRETEKHDGTYEHRQDFLKHEATSFPSYLKNIIRGLKEIIVQKTENVKIYLGKISLVLR